MQISLNAARNVCIALLCAFLYYPIATAASFTANLDELVFAPALEYTNVPQETSTPAATHSFATNPGNSRPVRIIIPSIKLNALVVDVGLDESGAMDVPSGKTGNVGWYEDGTVPGDSGTAVMDAHVFAAFSKLKNVADGSDVYVVMSNGQKLHFIVSFSETYALGDIVSGDLFGASSAPHLNLITCAGKLTPDHSTYDHRLIVYTRLAQ